MQSPTRSIAEELAWMAEVCAKMGSPFFGALLLRASRDYDADGTLRALLDRHAHRSRLALRLGGAAHYRALRGEAPAIAARYPSTGGDGDASAAWHAIARDIHEHLAAYDALLERNVQTNEVARSMPVLGAMLAFAHAARLPLRIFEIGSSAGLILNFDRYHYAGAGWTWGDAHSPVRLRNDTQSGTPAHTDASIAVGERHGCDLHPLDAANPDDADTLLGFVWPDQRERFERLRAALDVARAHPVRIVSGDGVAWARERARPRAGTATVVLHTVITEHMTPAVRASLRPAVDDLGRLASEEAPLAWIRMEPEEKNYGTRLTVWPGAAETLVATSDGHAQRLRWRLAS